MSRVTKLLRNPKAFFVDAKTKAADCDLKGHWGQVSQYHMRDRSLCLAAFTCSSLGKLLKKLLRVGFAVK
jgi:hypothetical protein